MRTATIKYIFAAAAGLNQRSRIKKLKRWNTPQNKTNIPQKNILNQGYYSRPLSSGMYNCAYFNLFLPNEVDSLYQWIKKNLHERNAGSHKKFMKTPQDCCNPATVASTEVSQVECVQKYPYY